MAYILIVFLLLGSAFFSGTEIAYTSLSKLKIKKEREHPQGIQRLVLFIYDHFDNALSTLLIGNNLVNIAATSIATVLAVKLAAGLGGRIEDDTASTIVTVVMTVLPSRELARLRAAVRAIDPDAFLIVHTVRDVRGNGFGQIGN